MIADRDLVLVGGGHTHALVLRAWGAAPLPGVRVTLIDPVQAAAYSGMLPGHVAGHYLRSDLDIGLPRLARFAGARFVRGAVTGIDREAARVEIAGHAPAAYDVLSLDIGITSAMPDLPGFAAHAVPAKPLARFATAWERFRARVAESEARAEVAVIGAGVAGAELALAMAHRLRRDDSAAAPQVTLIEAQTALRDLRPAGARLLRQRIGAMGVALIEHAAIARIGSGTVHLADGRAVRFGLCIGAAGAQPHPWLGGTGLPLTNGFVTVTPELRSPGDARLFAVGDCAHMARDPRPKAGVYAVRQAPVLRANLRAALGHGEARRYDPQRDYLKLVSLGEKSALAEKWGLSLAHPWLWRLKDRIDRAFMAQFRDLPGQAGPEA